MTYARNPLVEVILRADFPESTVITESDADKIFDAGKDVFKARRQDRQQVVLFQVGPRQQGQQQKEYLVYRFEDESTGSHLTVEPHAVIFSLKESRSFTEVKETVRNVFLALASANPRITESSRVGLRKIDRIRPGRGDPLDFNGWIVDKLLTPSTIVNPPTRLTRALGLVELTLEEFRVRFTYGWDNRDHPAPIAKREFLLDTDCFAEDSCAVSAIPDFAEKLNVYANELFENSVGPNLRRWMEGDNDDN